MSKYAVFGMGKFGRSLARELSEMGNEVLAVDVSEDKLQEVERYVTYCVVANVTDEEAVSQIAVEDYDAVIVSIGDNVENSLICSIILKELGVKKIWAKATSDLHAKILEKIGVERVILPEREMGIRIAHHITNNNIIDYISLSDEYQLVEITIKDEWIGKSISEINFRTKYGINIIGIRHGEDFTVNPHADHVIKENDVLSIVATDATIKNLL